MLASFLRCEQCDGGIGPEDIGLVGQKDGCWFFLVRCTNCGESRVLVVLVREEDEESQCGEAADYRGVEITWDDVLDTHLLLREFEGDFKSLLR